MTFSIQICQRKNDAGLLQIYLEKVGGNLSMMEFDMWGGPGGGPVRRRGGGASSVGRRSSSPRIKCERHVHFFVQCPPEEFFSHRHFSHIREKCRYWRGLVCIGRKYLISMFSRVTPQNSSDLLPEKIHCNHMNNKFNYFIPSKHAQPRMQELYLLVDNSKHTQIDIRLRAG